MLEKCLELNSTMLNYKKFLLDKNNIKFITILFSWILVSVIIYTSGNFIKINNKNSLAINDEPYRSYGSFETDINRITKLYIVDSEKLLANDLIKIFEKNNYEYENIIKYKKVPNIYISSLPKDFSEISSSKKKSLFIKSLLPLIIKENEKIISLNQRIRLLQSEFNQINRKDAVWLKKTLIEYKTNTMRVEDLLTKVDIIPVSIALAQAAIESGWGTSRFSIEGNALYGQWSWKKGSGIVPKERKKDENYEVKSFLSLGGSVESYMKNLNTHPNYNNFRINRALLRSHNISISGLKLYEYLNAYAADDKYAETLLNVIEKNNLDQFENVSIHFIVTEETLLDLI